MKNGIRIVAGLVLLAIPLLIPVGEGRDLAPVWSARHNGPGNGEDRARDIAVDGSGNVYVTGYSKGSGTGCDYATIKYNTNGKQLWVQRYNGSGNNYDFARALVLDGSGNVYVTGTSSDDYATIKYNTNGKQLWVQRYEGPAKGYDEACAIAVDGSGNVYVTGYSEGSGTGSDYATIKYNTNGKQLWVKRYNGPGNYWDAACAIAVDGSGNVYVTGQSSGSGTANDYATIKYDTNGMPLWVVRYNGPRNGEDRAHDIAVDGSGNVYVTGDSEGSGTYSDYATIKYGPKGRQLWAKRYNGPGDSRGEACAIAVDGSGNVYVTGDSAGDYATIKYNTNGILLWVQRFDGPGGGTDSPSDVAVDGSGNVYVTGGSEGPYFFADYATIKYDTNGIQIWVKRYNGLGNNDDQANAIAVDKSGNVYVSGESVGSGTSYDYLTIKY